VEFSTKGKPVAYLDFVVNKIDFFIDQAFVMFMSEMEQLRKQIKFMVPRKILMHKSEKEHYSTLVNGVPTSTCSVRCNDPDVICAVLKTTNEGEGRNFTFKYRLGNAPESKDLYFVFFDDKYCTNVIGIWKITVHALIRLLTFN
jgi:hypothetical protein